MRLHATAPPGAPTPRPAPAPAAWLVVILLLGAVAIGGCGGSESTEATSASPTSAAPAPDSDDPLEPGSEKPSTEPSEPPPEGSLNEPGLVALESASQAEGATDAPPVFIERLDDVAELTAGLDPRLADAVRARARSLLPRVAEDLELVGAVVWVGCEIPSDVTVDGAGDDVTLTAVVPDKGSVQCLVPVTTVALATAPISAG